MCFHVLYVLMDYAYCQFEGWNDLSMEYIRDNIISNQSDFD